MRPVPRLMPAIVTPFTEEGALDVDAHAFNVDRLSAAGIDGFVIGGSTGEGPYLEPGERATLIRTTRDAAPNAFVLAGVVAESLRAGMRLAAEAAGAGADGVLAMTPTTLVRHRPDLVAGYYETLADTCEVPLFLYSVPRLTAYDLPLDVAAGLAEHPNIAGIKDSSGDLDRARVLAETPFTVFVGASAIVTSAIVAGVHGAITASTNFAAPLTRPIVETAVAGTPDHGLQTRLTALSKAVEAHGVPGVKHAAELTGLRPGLPRLPLRLPTPEAAAEIGEALRDALLVT